MSAVEKLLQEGLDRDPSDWTVRLELATKLNDRGADAEAAETIASAPAPPASETEFSRALALAGDHVSDTRSLIEQFVAENPSSALAHHQLAAIHAVDGEIERARKHFQTATALDSEIEDPELESLLAEDEKAAPEPEPITEAVEVAEAVPVAEEVVTPVTTARSLSSDQEEPEPQKKASPAAAAALAADFDEPELEVEAEAAMVDPGEEIEYAGTGERAFIVAEGEMVHAHEKESDVPAKVSALTLAILVHVGIFALLALIAISMPRPNPPQLVASSVPSTDKNELEQKTVERLKRRPSESAAAQMQIVTAVAASPVAMPDIQTDNLTFDPIGTGDSFGMSMNFTDENGAGMVSFFGSKSKAQKVIFVVDASASMKSAGSTGKQKFQLMKEELIKSLEALPPSVEYQVIFFSGPAWFVADGYTKDNWNQWEKNGKKLNFWHFKDGDPKNLPEGKYIDATKSKIRKTKKEIEELKMSYGTDWRAPLEMAMNMRPDVIFFMTDGAVGKHPDKPNVVDHLVKYNKELSTAKLNTICLMQLQAFEDLKALADKTRGEFTLVLEDGTAVRGRDVEKMAGKKKK